MKLDYNPQGVIKHVLKEYIAINKKIMKASTTSLICFYLKTH